MAFTLTDSLSFTGTGTNSSVHLNSVTNYSASIVTIASNGAITSVTDSKGNPYTTTVNTSNAGLFLYEFHSFYAILDNTTTITVTPTSGATVWSATWQLVSGGLNTLDVSAFASGTGTAISSGATATTTSATEFVLGFGAQQNNRPWTNGSGYTSIQQSANGATASVYTEYANVSSTGAQIATASIDISSNWVFGVATFSSATLTVPTIVQSASYNDAGGSSTTASITLPSTPTPGNLLLWFGSFDLNKTYFGDPSGWSPIGTNAYTNGRAAMSSLTRVVQSGDTATFAIHQITTADTETAVLYEVTGIPASAYINGFIKAGSSTVVTANTSGSVTPTVLNTLAIGFFAEDTGSNGTAGSDVATITSGWQFDQRPYAAFHASWGAHRTTLTANTTTAMQATVSGTSSSANSSIVVLIAPYIAPAAPTTPKTLLLMGVGA